MDFFQTLNITIAFFQTNVPIAIAITLLLVFLLFRKPKLFFTVFFIALLLLGVLYLVSSLSSLGLSHKKELFNK